MVMPKSAAAGAVEDNTPVEPKGETKDSSRVACTTAEARVAEVDAGSEFKKVLVAFDCDLVCVDGERWAISTWLRVGSNTVLS
jgi:hypothetical protein